MAKKYYGSNNFIDPLIPDPESPPAGIDNDAYKPTNCIPVRAELAAAQAVSGSKSYPIKIRTDEVTVYAGWPLVVSNQAVPTTVDPVTGEMDDSCNILHPAGEGYLDVVYGNRPEYLENTTFYTRQNFLKGPVGRWGGAQLTMGNGTLYSTHRNFIAESGKPIALYGRYLKGTLLDEDVGSSDEDNTSDLGAAGGSILDVGIIEAAYVKSNGSFMSAKIYGGTQVALVNTVLFPSIIESKFFVSTETSQISAEIYAPFILLHAFTMAQDSTIEADEYLKLQGAEAFTVDIKLTGHNKSVTEYSLKTLYADEGHYAITTSTLKAPLITIDGSSLKECEIECNESLFSTSHFNDCTIALQPGATGEYNEDHPNPNPSLPDDDGDGYPDDLYHEGGRNKALFDISPRLSRVYEPLVDLYFSLAPIVNTPGDVIRTQNPQEWKESRSFHQFNVRNCNEDKHIYASYPGFDNPDTGEPYEWIDRCIPVLTQEPNQVRFDAAIMDGRKISEDTKQQIGKYHVTTHALEDCHFTKSSVTVSSGVLFMKGCTFIETALQLKTLYTCNNTTFGAKGSLIVEKILKGFKAGELFGANITMNSQSKAELARLNGMIKIKANAGSEVILHQDEMIQDFNDGYLVAEPGSNITFTASNMQIQNMAGTKYAGNFTFVNLDPTTTISVRDKVTNTVNTNKKGPGVFTLEKDGTLEAVSISSTFPPRRNNSRFAGHFIANDADVVAQSIELETIILRGAEQSSTTNGITTTTNTANLECPQIFFYSLQNNGGFIDGGLIEGAIMTNAGEVTCTTIDVDTITTTDPSSTTAVSLTADGGTLRGTVNVENLTVIGVSLANQLGSIGTLLATNCNVDTQGETMGVAELTSCRSTAPFATLGTDVTFFYSIHSIGPVEAGKFISSDCFSVVITNCTFQMDRNSVSATSVGTTTFGPLEEGEVSNDFRMRDRSNVIGLTQRGPGSITISPSSSAGNLLGDISNLSIGREEFDSVVNLQQIIENLNLDIQYKQEEINDRRANGQDTDNEEEQLEALQEKLQFILSAGSLSVNIGEPEVTTSISHGGVIADTVNVENVANQEGFDFDCKNLSINNCAPLGISATGLQIAITDTFLRGGGRVEAGNNTLTNVTIAGDQKGQMSVTLGNHTNDFYSRSYPNAFIPYYFEESIVVGRNVPGQQQTRHVRARGIFYISIFERDLPTGDRRSPGYHKALAKAQAALPPNLNLNPPGDFFFSKAGDTNYAYLSRTVSCTNHIIDNSFIESATAEETLDENNPAHISKFSSCEIYNTAIQGMTNFDQCLLENCSSSSSRLRLTETSIKGTLNISNARNYYTEDLLEIVLPALYMSDCTIVTSATMTVVPQNALGHLPLIQFLSSDNRGRIKADGCNLYFNDSTNSSPWQDSTQAEYLSFRNSSNQGYMKAKNFFYLGGSTNSNIIEADRFYGDLSNIGSKVFEYNTSFWVSNNGATGGPNIILNVGSYHDKGFSFDLGPVPQYQPSSFNSSDYKISSTSDCLSDFGDIQVTTSNEFLFNNRRASPTTFKLNRAEYNFRNIPDEKPIGFYGAADNTFSYYGQTYRGTRIINGQQVRYYSGDVLLHISQQFTGQLNYGTYDNDIDYNGSFEYDQNEECAPNTAASFPFTDPNNINTTTSHDNGQTFGMNALPSHYGIRIFAPADSPDPYRLIDVIPISTLESQTFSGYILEQIIIPVLLNRNEAGKSDNLPMPEIKIKENAFFASIWGA